MTAHPPPPGGAPPAAPAAPPPSAVTDANVWAPVAPAQPPTPYAVPGAPFGQPGHAGRPGEYGLPSPPSGGSSGSSGTSGTNGLAIAALCCGLGAFVPLAGVLAVVFGVIALKQLRAGLQRGRGLAVAGIVLGVLATLAWALVVIAIATGAGDLERDATGKPAPGQTVSVQDLEVGDCFDGVPVNPDAAVDEVTSRSCTTPHQAQIAAVVQLPAGSFPGDDKAADLADRACGDAVDPLVRDDAPDLDLSYLYPDSAVAWRLDRHATCILEFTSGKHAGSVLT